jgi:hypothetical protein
VTCDENFSFSEMNILSLVSSLSFLTLPVFPTPINPDLVPLAFVGPAILNDRPFHSRVLDPFSRVPEFSPAESYRDYGFITNRLPAVKGMDDFNMISGVCQLDLNNYFNTMLHAVNLLKDPLQKKKVQINIREHGFSKTSVANIGDALIVGDLKQDTELLVFDDAVNEQIGIVVPGTKNLNNLAHDLQVGMKYVDTKTGRVRVHFGFWKSFMEIKDVTREAIRRVMNSKIRNYKGITIFGHSMGGAIGALLARELNMNKIDNLPVNFVSIGCPPLSNPEFSKEDMGNIVYHMYIPGDFVYELTKYTELKHPGGPKVPLNSESMEDPMHHQVKEYLKSYTKGFDTCLVDFN